MGSVDDDPSLADHASAPIENSARIYPQTATLVDLSSNFAGQLPPSSRRFSLCSPHHRRLSQPAALAALRSPAKLLSKDGALRIAANIAKQAEGACVRFGRAHIIMARRRNITPRFGIEDEIFGSANSVDQRHSDQAGNHHSWRRAIRRVGRSSKAARSDRGIPRWRKPRTGAMELACHVTLSRHKRQECDELSYRSSLPRWASLSLSYPFLSTKWI